MPVYSVAADGSFVASPINLANGAVYLTLYGTGLQAAGTAGVKATVNGVAAQGLYAGPSSYSGVDQVNILLPASLAERATSISR